MSVWIFDVGGFDVVVGGVLLMILFLCFIGDGVFGVSFGIF